jgi:hypothetical protein
MSWTNPKTFSLGETVTALTLNKQVRDNLNALRPHTTKGDIAKKDSSLVRLPVGANTLPLKSIGGDLIYSDASGFKVGGGYQIVPAASEQFLWGEGHTYPTVEYNNGGLLSSNYKLLIPEGCPGLYFIGASATINIPETTTYLQQINLTFNDGNKNSHASYGYPASITDYYTYLNVNTIAYLSPGDTCYMQIYIRSAALSGHYIEISDASFWAFRVI